MILQDVRKSQGLTEFEFRVATKTSLNWRDCLQQLILKKVSYQNLYRAFWFCLVPHTFHTNTQNPSPSLTVGCLEVTGLGEPGYN